MKNLRDNERHELRKKRKGYTSTISNQRQKFSTVGRHEVDNHGRPTDDNLVRLRNSKTGSSEKIY
jgi:hypothetical protein